MFSVAFESEIEDSLRNLSYVGTAIAVSRTLFVNFWIVFAVWLLEYLTHLGG